MNTEERILAVLKQNKEAMSAGQIAGAAGIDRKEVDKGMKKLRDSGSIVSPRRCYWTAG